jgi:hypothetical protein
MIALKKGFRVVSLVVILTAPALMEVGSITVFGDGGWGRIVFSVCAATVASYCKVERYGEQRKAIVYLRKSDFGV